MVTKALKFALCIALSGTSVLFASESGKLAARAQGSLKAGKFAKGYSQLERALVASRKEADLNSETRIFIAMGQVRTMSLDFELADSLLNVTRFEDAAKIITDVESGVREATMDYVSIKDRKTAIKYGLKFLKEGDSLLVAGKGAENYQEIMGVKHEFSDKKVVLEMVEDNV